MAFLTMARFALTMCGPSRWLGCCAGGSAPESSSQEIARALYSLSPQDVETLQTALQQDGDGGLATAPARRTSHTRSRAQLPPRP